VTESAVRGAGRPRGGASDTTMLIWKVIAASPGITRQGIWEQVEHGIPEGYAMRRYMRARPGVSARSIESARNYVLSDALTQMRRSGSIASEHDGTMRHYTVGRELGYHGNPETIDTDGRKAAEHMALADALRILRKAIAKGDPTRASGPIFPCGHKEYCALVVAVEALTAKGPQS